MHPIKAIIIAIVAACTSAQATLYDYSFNGINTLIPDGDPNGYANSQTVPNLGGNETSQIVDVNVQVNITGGYNGDLYGYLVHDSGFAILLNRVGKTANNDIGYANTGFNVTFDDQAATDIHLYQATSYSLNGNGALLGSWKPDGRNVDPDDVLDTSPRTALLSSFNGLNASGAWTLFLADDSFGDQSTLVSWDLQISVVPEPIAWALIIFGSVAATIAIAVKQIRRREQLAAKLEFNTPRLSSHPTAH